MMNVIFNDCFVIFVIPCMLMCSIGLKPKLAITNLGSKYLELVLLSPQKKKTLSKTINGNP